MSVIISRALPDVRDGLKPLQRRILVAMNDLGSTSASRTSKWRDHRRRDGQYHPHGDTAIYPTPGAHGPGLGTCARRWSTGRATSARSTATRRRPCATPSAPRQGRRRDARRPRQGHRRLHAQLRRQVPRAARPARQVPQPAGQRLGRHRRRHGHQHPAAQPGRGLRRPHPRDRRARRSTSTSCVDIIQGPDFPTGGIILGRRASSRPTTGRGKVILRSEDRRGGPRPHRRSSRGALPGQQARWSSASPRSWSRKEALKGIPEIRDE